MDHLHIHIHSRFCQVQDSELFDISVPPLHQFLTTPRHARVEEKAPSSSSSGGTRGGSNDDRHETSRSRCDSAGGASVATDRDSKEKDVERKRSGEECPVEGRGVLEDDKSCCPLLSNKVVDLDSINRSLAIHRHRQYL